MKKKTLYFENSEGKRRVIATVSNESDAITKIYDFLRDHKYTSYYCRTWVTDDGEKWFDVGSHTEFFILK